MFPGKKNCCAKDFNKSHCSLEYCIYKKLVVKELIVLPNIQFIHCLCIHNLN